VIVVSTRSIAPLLATAFALIVSVATVRAAPAPHNARLAEAIPGIDSLIEHSGADVAVAFHTLDGQLQWMRRTDENFHAASTMKIGVMLELYHQVKQGRVRLTDTLRIKNEFSSLVHGSPFSLDPADDSDADLYKAVGETRTLEQLNELMITVSSNLATNLLIDKLGVENIRATVHGMGADGLNILRGLEDAKAFAKGMNNTTTARALSVLMTAIAHGQALDANSSAQMLAILKRQAFNTYIPAGLPPGTVVAHKTGEITGIAHDAAIVYGPRPFVLVILTRGLAKPEDAAALMAEITRRLYAVVTER
jgi:beta-lactamase class A